MVKYYTYIHIPTQRTWILFKENKKLLMYEFDRWFRLSEGIISTSEYLNTKFRFLDGNTSLEACLIQSIKDEFEIIEIND